MGGLVSPYTPQQHANDHQGLGMVHVTYSGLNVSVPAFQLNTFTFSGGTISVIPNCTWYIGIDLFRNVLIALPRLGHRGWIPVAKVMAGASAITSLLQIAPVMPATRIPRTMKKIVAGVSINVLVLGSSLAEGGGSNTDWSGMLFNSVSSTANYKVPNIGFFLNYALGGAPNQYQLAQCGFATSYMGTDYTDSGYTYAIAGKKPPNGRSNMFNNIDLVVLTTLANGGDYRLECIEPIIRKIRKQGCEVILCTDNPQGMPFANTAAMQAAALYTDGPECVRVADLYGIELADTAAYVFDAYWRYPTTNIYRDSIHMAYGAPAGRTAAPAGGYEVWARAIRSLLPVDTITYGPTTYNYVFNATNGLAGFMAFNSASTMAVDTVLNRASITKNTAATSQWGGWSPVLIPINTGDTVVVSGTFDPGNVTNSPTVGLQGTTTQGGAGWSSNSVGLGLVAGTFSITLTATRQNNFVQVLFFGNNDPAALNSVFYISNLTITVNSTATSSAFELVTQRPQEIKALPPVRRVTDMKTPGDAYVILPADEFQQQGALGAHPWGAGSFARRFNTNVGATSDLLTLTTGQRAACGAFCMVGMSLIYYSLTTDPVCTFDVYSDNVFLQTVTIAANSGNNREAYLPLTTPTAFGQSAAMSGLKLYSIRVTSGTLRIAAFVALTADYDLVPPEDLTYVGSFVQAVGVAPNMSGYATDNLNDYVYYRCPEHAQRVGFFLMSKSMSSPVNVWSGQEVTLSQTNIGVNHMRTVGGKRGPGELHYCQCAAANTSGNSIGYGMLVGGAIVVNDR